jgi:hypothetical protein
MSDLDLSQASRVSCSNGGGFVKAACTSLALASLCILGCEDLSGQSGTPQQPPAAKNAVGVDSGGESEGLETEPGARSALGKAKERAERLVNEEVAEYNRKLEEAAEGKYL